MTGLHSQWKSVCRSRSTLRSTLVQVKQPSEDRKKKGVVYEVPYQDCDCVYIGETSKILEKRLGEHKNAVKKHDSNNGIAAHAWTNQHQVDWKAAKTREMEGNYWKRRVLEALHIHQQNTPPTWTVVWQSILPGYLCLTNLHALDTFLNIFIT